MDFGVKELALPFLHMQRPMMLGPILQACCSRKFLTKSQCLHHSLRLRSLSPRLKKTQQANPTPAEKKPTVIDLLFVLGKATVAINDALQNGDSPKSFSLQGTSLISGSYSCTYECAGKLRTLRFYKYERCKPTLSCPLKSEEASYVGKSLEGKDHLCRN
jgi:hypothetical protein